MKLEFKGNSDTTYSESSFVDSTVSQLVKNCCMPTVEIGVDFQRRLNAIIN